MFSYLEQRIFFRIIHRIQVKKRGRAGSLGGGPAPRENLGKRGNQRDPPAPGREGPAGRRSGPRRGPRDGELRPRGLGD